MPLFAFISNDIAQCRSVNTSETELDHTFLALLSSSTMTQVLCTLTIIITF